MDTDQGQALADRVINFILLILSKQPLNPEQEALQARIEPGVNLLRQQKETSLAYNLLARNPGVPKNRADFRDKLLAEWNANPALQVPFEEAFALRAVPAWLEEPPAPVDANAPTQPLRVVEVPQEAVPAPHAAEPAANTALPSPGEPPAPETLPTQAEEPVNVDPNADLLNQLTRRLRTEPAFLRIVSALAYPNPSLFSLAEKLAEQPGLSSVLCEFLDRSALGKALLADGNPQHAAQEADGAPSLPAEFSAVLKSLGEMKAHYRLACDLSDEAARAYPVLFGRLMTQPGYAHLKERLIDQSFFLTITQLADMDCSPIEFGLAEKPPISESVKRLLDDDAVAGDRHHGLRTLLPRLVNKNDLGDVILALGENQDGLEGLVRRLALGQNGDADLGTAVSYLLDDRTNQVTRLLADKTAQPLVNKLASDPELKYLATRLSAEADNFRDLVRPVAADETIAQGLAFLEANPGVAERLTPENPEFRALAPTLADDDALIHLVTGLAASQEVRDLDRRLLDDEEGVALAAALNNGPLYDLVKGIGEDPETQALAQKIYTTSLDGFSGIAAQLAEKKELTNLVRMMLDKENARYQSLATRLTAGGNSAQTILAVVDKPEIAATVDQMLVDEPRGFHELVLLLKNNPDLVKWVIALLANNLIQDLHDYLLDPAMDEKGFSKRLVALGDRLYAAKQEDKAINAYQMARLLDPANSQAYLGHARACRAREYFDLARADYEEMLKLNLQPSKANLELGELLMHEFLETDEAAKYFDEVLKISKDDDERHRANDALARLHRRRR